MKNCENLSAIFMRVLGRLQVFSLAEALSRDSDSAYRKPKIV
jgi:hypothetical protein